MDTPGLVCRDTELFHRISKLLFVPAAVKPEGTKAEANPRRQVEASDDHGAQLCNYPTTSIAVGTRWQPSGVTYG
jgi:hypothetical protein